MISFPFGFRHVQVRTVLVPGSVLVRYGYIVNTHALHDSIKATRKLVEAQDFFNEPPMDCRFVKPLFLKASSITTCVVHIL